MAKRKETTEEIGTNKTNSKLNKQEFKQLVATIQKTHSYSKAPAKCNI